MTAPPTQSQNHLPQNAMALLVRVVIPVSGVARLFRRRGRRFVVFKDTRNFAENALFLFRRVLLVPIGLPGLGGLRALRNLSSRRRRWKRFLAQAENPGEKPTHSRRLIACVTRLGPPHKCSRVSLWA